jgi:hypothetical protein
VLAYGAAKVHPHTYRRTLGGAFASSTHLLINPLPNVRAGRSIERSREGANRRLPGNATILRFAMLLGRRNLQRLAYGPTRRSDGASPGCRAFTRTAVHGTVNLEVLQKYPVSEATCCRPTRWSSTSARS